MPLASKNHRGANMESSERAGHALIVVLQTPVPARSSSLILVGRPSGIRPRLNSQTRVYDDSMPKLAGWSWAIVAGLLTGVTVSAQTLNNQSLSGKYYFRHISLGTNSPRPASPDSDGQYHVQWQRTLRLYWPAIDRPWRCRFTDRVGRLFTGPGRLRLARQPPASRRQNQCALRRRGRHRVEHRIHRQYLRSVRRNPGAHGWGGFRRTL